MKQGNTEDSRLLLGMAGWPHPEWEGRYFPADLPPDWQFSYYSNEADCLLLPLRDWLEAGEDQLGEWLDDAPGHFRFFLEVGDTPVPAAALAPFSAHLGGLLVSDFLRLDSDLPQFRQAAGGYWEDARGEPRVWCLAELPDDLREQRVMLQQMPSSVRVLIVTDSRTDPGALADTRSIAELLRVA